MDERTRRQLLELSRAFYRAHAADFDESRGHRPWPGWERIATRLPHPASRPLRVLDVGCGNARLATFLARALAPPGAASHGPPPLDYVGVDADPALLAAARRRLAPACADRATLLELDFLAPCLPPPATGSAARPGDGLPDGPFDLVALFGVLHHVPGRDWREALLAAARDRLHDGGRLALAAWRFAGRPRFRRREVPWSALPPVLGARLDPAGLEPGDHLLRFGSDPDRPPRYCHQLSDTELDALPARLGLVLEDDFLADGREGDLNRYLVLRRVGADPP